MTIYKAATHMGRQYRQNLKMENEKIEKNG